MIEKNIFKERYVLGQKKVICDRNSGLGWPGFIFKNGMVKICGHNNVWLENYKKIQIQGDSKVSDFLFSWTEIILALNYLEPGHNNLIEKNIVNNKKVQIDSNFRNELKNFYEKDADLDLLVEFLYENYYTRNFGTLDKEDKIIR